MGDVAMTKPETHFQQVPIKVVAKIAKPDDLNSKKSIPVGKKKSRRAQTSHVLSDKYLKGG